MQLLDQMGVGGEGWGGWRLSGLLGATFHVFISGYVTTVWSLSITQSAERTASLSPQEEEKRYRRRGPVEPVQQEAGPSHRPDVISLIPSAALTHVPQFGR